MINEYFVRVALHYSQVLKTLDMCPHCSESHMVCANKFCLDHQHFRVAYGSKHPLQYLV